MRTFYKDDTRPTGWNNAILKNAAMPHVLWQLQGIQTAKMADEIGEDGKTVSKLVGFEQVTPGTMNKLEFDTNVADLVGYMEWMAEPTAQFRKRLGVWVLLFLSGFAILAWRLNASFWKEVKEVGRRSWSGACFSLPALAGDRSGVIRSRLHPLCF